MMRELRFCHWFAAAPASRLALANEMESLLGGQDAQREVFQALAPADSSPLLAPNTLAALGFFSPPNETFKAIKIAHYSDTRAKKLYLQARLLMDSPSGWKSSDAVRLQVACEMLDNAAMLSTITIGHYNLHSALLLRVPLLQSLLTRVAIGVQTSTKGKFNVAWGAWTVLLDSVARLGDYHVFEPLAEEFVKAARLHGEKLHADGERRIRFSSSAVRGTSRVCSS